MAVRVTRQYVEVLLCQSAGDQSITSTLTLSQEAVPELIQAAIELVATDTLSFSQVARLTTPSLSALSSVEFASDVARGHGASCSAANACEFTQTASGFLLTFDVSSDICFDQSPHLCDEFTEDVTHDISFEQNTSLIFRKLIQEVVSDIAFVDGADQGAKARTATHEIAFGQTATVTSGIQLIDVYQHIPFEHSAEAHGTIRLAVDTYWDETYYTFETIETPGGWTAIQVQAGDGLRSSVDREYVPKRGPADYLAIQDVAAVTLIKGSATSLSAESTVAFLQGESLAGHLEGVTSSLILGQTATGELVTPAENSLALSHGVALEVIGGKTIGHTVAFGHAVSFEITSLQSPNTYSPLVGEGASDAPIPPEALQGPTAGVHVPFQLVYPVTGVVIDSVTLKAPDLGNKDRLNFSRISRETRGGTLIVFADSKWPKLHTLVLSFSGLRRTEAQALLAFMGTYLGQEIGLIDWEHRYWRGVILAPDQPVIENSSDNFSASFEFQGELDPTWTP